MKNQKGFTLIEILIVVALIGVVVTITSDALLQIVRTSNRANIVIEVKQNGDSAMSQIERLIRNAKNISEVGKRNFGDTLTSWDTTLDQFSCKGNIPNTGNNLCAVIIENADGSESLYSKIEFELESTSVNGVIRIADGATVTELENTVGNIITNNEPQSGISLTDIDLGVRKDPTKKVPLVLLSYKMAQAINASSRVDSKADVLFETVLSLRNY